jgi:P27 family predicted phage terminase small subunit
VAETNSTPSGLSSRSRRIWRSITEEFEFDDARRAILEEALRSLDRASEAAAIVDAEGVVYRDRFGQPKQHPATLVERDARGTAARLLATLGLDYDEEVVGFADR